MTGAGHRLDDAADLFAVARCGGGDGSGRLDRRRGELVDRLAFVAQDADVDSISTEIETSVQHEKWASLVAPGFDAGSVSPGRPSFIAFLSGSEGALL
jgi:hypothetical protein